MKKKLEWRQHKVKIGASRENGYTGREAVVRTNGTDFEKREEERLDLCTSLKSLAKQVNELLAAHPDAEVRSKPEPYTDHDYYHVVEWWVPLMGDDPLSIEAIQQAREAEESQRKFDEQQLARLKKERPDLF